MKYIFLIFTIAVFFSCKHEGCTDSDALNYDSKAKEDDGSCEYDTIIPLNFISLIAADDTISPGTSTDITATVEGTGLTYQWVSSGGDLLGTGNVISFTATPCMYGEYSVTCTISDYSNTSSSKSTKLYVF